MLVFRDLCYLEGGMSKAGWKVLGRSASCMGSSAQGFCQIICIGQKDPSERLFYPEISPDFLFWAKQPLLTCSLPKIFNCIQSAWAGTASWDPDLPKILGNPWFCRNPEALPAGSGAAFGQTGFQNKCFCPKRLCCQNHWANGLCLEGHLPNRL